MQLVDQRCSLYHSDCCWLLACSLGLKLCESAPLLASRQQQAQELAQGGSPLPALAAIQTRPLPLCRLKGRRAWNGQARKELVVGCRTACARHVGSGASNLGTRAPGGSSCSDVVLFGYMPIASSWTCLKPRSGGAARVTATAAWASAVRCCAACPVRRCSALSPPLNTQTYAPVNARLGKLGWYVALSVMLDSTHVQRRSSTLACPKTYKHR